jgi:adenine-specific DNA-methyltransferase
VEGKTLAGESTLAFWRDCDKVGYDEVLAITEKLRIRPGETEYDVIYINGDNTIPNLVTTEDGGSRTLKLRLIEDEFLSRMFNVEDVL